MRSAHCSASILDVGAQTLVVDPIKVHAETFSLNRCSHTSHLHTMLKVNYGPLIVLLVLPGS